MNKYKKEIKLINPINLDKSKLTNIIVNGNIKELNEYAMDLASKFVTKLKIEIVTQNKKETKEEKELTTSQIRNIFDAIQRMQKYEENKLQLLRPKLAYLAGRHGGRVKEFQELIESSLPLVTDDNTFINFKNFLEAIVAYHKFYGGGE